MEGVCQLLVHHLTSSRASGMHLTLVSRLPATCGGTRSLLMPRQSHERLNLTLRYTKPRMLNSLLRPHALELIHTPAYTFPLPKHVALHANAVSMYRGGLLGDGQDAGF